MVIGYLKSIGTGNMNNYIVGALALVLVAGTWIVQDWRYDSKIAKMQTAYAEEKTALVNETNLQLIAEREKSFKLSQELIDAKNKNQSIKVKNKGKIDEFAKSNPAVHQFSADWVRIYNSSLSNSSE